MSHLNRTAYFDCAHFDLSLSASQYKTSCVPNGTPAPVGFYPTEALSLTGQETDKATETALATETAKPFKRAKHTETA